MSVILLAGASAPALAMLRSSMPLPTCRCLVRMDCCDRGFCQAERREPAGWNRCAGSETDASAPFTEIRALVARSGDRSLTYRTLRFAPGPELGPVDVVVPPDAPPPRPPV